MVAELRSPSVMTGRVGSLTAQTGAASAARRLSGFGRVLLATAVVSVAWTFRWPIGWLWRTWMDRPEYSHGPIMPFIAAFLVWQRRDELAALEFDGDWLGLVVMAVAALLFALGVIGAAYSVQQYALIFMVAGLTLALTGRRAFQKLLAPLAVLLLMIPQPDFILNNLSARLQLLSSSIGVQFIRALGISVFLEGNVIDLGGYRLQVVEACDGMRYLFPLMTIGLLIAYFYKGAMWKRVCVFLLSIPITVLMNSFRVGAIGLLVEHWGSSMAEGFLHEFQGWMVFMLSTALLLGAAMLLNRVGHESAPWQRRFGLVLPGPRARDAVTKLRPVPWTFAVAVGFSVSLAMALAFLPARAEVVPSRSSFAGFPLRIGEWTGRREALGADVLSVLQLDDYVLANYVDTAGEPVGFYVSYYNTQRDRRVVHSPRACIPGSGWHIDDLSQIEVPGTGVRANRMLVLNGDARQLIYYWFDQRGRNLTSELSVKWFLFWDSVTRHRSDGAMVRLVTPLGRGEAAEVGDARLASFARAAVGAVHAYLPP
jgi:exosortase D (VPLPA-CTERM-specific)